MVPGIYFPSHSHFPETKRRKGGENGYRTAKPQNQEKQLTAKLAKIDSSFEPGYLKLHKSGELKKRGETLWNMLSSVSWSR